jgi:hypothetical protein
LETETELQNIPHTPEQGEMPDQHSSSTTILLRRKRKQRHLVLANSGLRRSLRIKAANTGFKAAGCGKKSCLGCELDPPSLSNKIIKNLGEEFCKMDPKDLSDATLKASHTTKKAVSKVEAKTSEGAAIKKPQKPPKKSVKNEDTSKKIIKKKRK